MSEGYENRGNVVRTAPIAVVASPAAPVNNKIHTFLPYSAKVRSTRMTVQPNQPVVKPGYQTSKVLTKKWFVIGQKMIRDFRFCIRGARKKGGDKNPKRDREFSIVGDDGIQKPRVRGEKKRRTGNDKLSKCTDRAYIRCESIATSRMIMVVRGSVNRVTVCVDRIYRFGE